MPSSISSAPDDLEQLLARLSPVAELSAEHRAHLAHKARFLELKPGLRLEARDEHRWMGYLVSGKLNLVCDSTPELLTPDAARAVHPIFRHDRLRDYAVALTPGRLLRIDRQLYETLLKDETRTGIELEDLELTEVEGEIIASLYRACLRNTLELPSMPEVALAIRKATEDPDVHLNELSRIVQTDMAVTGGLIKAANSAVYGGSAPVANVGAAIRRLGMDTTRQLVMGIAMRRVFETDAPNVRTRMHELWEHSVRVSALSFAIARHCGGFDPDQALLAGLLHDVGIVPILDYIGRHNPDIGPDEIERIISTLHGMTGELVVSHWGLGPRIAQVVREVDQWHRGGSDDGKADYCDVVQVARLYACAQQGRTDVPRFDSVPAFERLGLGTVSDGERIDPLEEAEAEIAAVMALLRGA
jgi:HD-like signal output (HDOD) protein